MTCQCLLFYDKKMAPRKVAFQLALSPRNRFFLALAMSLLATCAALSTKAQDPPGGQPLDAKTTRNIELTLRSKLGIPSEYEIHLGTRTPSKTPGFSTLPVSFELPSHPEHSQKLDFLISDDNKTLERISKWDVSVDPAGMIAFFEMLQQEESRRARHERTQHQQGEHELRMQAAWEARAQKGLQHHAAFETELSRVSRSNV